MLRKSISTQSSSFQKKKKKRKIWLIVLVALSILSWSFALIAFSSLPFMMIEKINIYGVGDDISSDIDEVIHKSLEGNYFGLFPRSNIFLYPEKQMVSSIKNDFLRVEKISIKRGSDRSLDFSILEKVPVAIICAKLPDFSLEENSVDFYVDCYFADKTGLIFRDYTDSISNSRTRVNLYIPSIMSSSSDISGSSVMSEDRFSGLISFYENVRVNDIKIYGILIGVDGNHEMYIHSYDDIVPSGRTDDIVVVHFNERVPYEDSISNLISFWRHMKSQSKKIRLSEIKLQFPPNVYYTEIR